MSTKVYSWLTLPESEAVSSAEASSDSRCKDLVKTIHRLRGEVARLQALTPRRDELDRSSFLISKNKMSEIAGEEALFGLKEKEVAPIANAENRDKFYVCHATSKGENGIDVWFEPRVADYPSEEDEEPECEFDESREQIFFKLKVSRGEPAIFGGATNAGFKITFRDKSVVVKTSATSITIQSEDDWHK